jgi:hypothetical protein
VELETVFGGAETKHTVYQLEEQRNIQQVGSLYATYSIQLVEPANTHYRL